MVALVEQVRDAARVRARPRYFSVQMHLLHECNLRCTHCYDLAHAALKMPPTHEILRRLDLVYAFGRTLGVVPDLHLSGGEPTLRKDLLLLVERIFAEPGGDALLFTNGVRWKPGLDEALWDKGLRCVQVSLEGPEPVHDAVRGPGSFQAAMGTLRRLVDRGYRCTVSITVTAKNFPFLFDFCQQLDPLGVHFHVREVFALGGGANLLGLDRQQRRALAEWAVGWRGRSTLGVEDPVHCSVSAAFARGETGCVAGRNHLCIDVDGAVFPCRPLALKVGHVDDLPGAWHSPAMTRMRDRDYGGACGRCTLRWHCGGCRVHAQAAGDLFGEDPRCFAEEEGLLMTPRQGRMLRAGERLGRKLGQVRAVLQRKVTVP